jgi:hypothetical protein
MRIRPILTILFTLALAAPLEARTLNPDKPADALEISKRVQCGAKDGVPAVYYWSGNVYSRVQGEPDRLLFRGEGMNIRQCVTITDPVRGRGYRQVSREVMFYLDPETGKIVRQWKNPWTGDVVDVMQIANDPVNSRPNYPINADGTPYTTTLKRAGRWIFQPVEVPLFYHNVLGGDYQDHVGGQYHAMEIFDFAFDANEMLETKIPTAYPIISWVRVSGWMPWMKMRDREGQMVFNAMGRKLKSFDELPSVIKDEIALNYPTYTTPPPADDARANATTWTEFRKWVAEKQVKESAAQNVLH